MFYIPKSLYDLHKCFLLNFFTPWKWIICVKEQWPKKSPFQSFWPNVMLSDSRVKRGWKIFESLTDDWVRKGHTNLDMFSVLGEKKSRA